MRKNRIKYIDPILMLMPEEDQILSSRKDLNIYNGMGWLVFATLKYFFFYGKR